MDNERRTLRAWGAEVFVSDTGSAVTRAPESDLPVLVLHGEEGPDSVRPLVDGLAEDSRVIAVTHPGFDRGSRITGVDRPQQLAYLYLDLLDALDVRLCAVVGSSLGAWIALEMAVMDPQRFASLTAIGALGVKFNGREELSFAEIVVQSPERIREIVYADPERDPSRERSAPDEIVKRAEYRESFMHYGWEPYLHNPNLPALLPRIAAPVLLIAGEADQLAPKGYYESLVAALPDGRLERVPDAGHYPEIERPAETVELLREFSVAVDAAGKEASE